VNKRALLFLGAGLACAAVVVLIARKYLASGASDGQQPRRATILLAVKQVEFGTPMILKEGEQEGNVAFVPWPEDLVPEGAIMDPKMVKEKNLVALASFVRHEPILQGEVIEESQFIGPGMCPVRVRVDPKDVADGLLKAGMMVDVIVDFEEFMRCARIYSLGELNYRERESSENEEGPIDHVYLLIKQDDRLAFLKAQERGRLNLLPAKYSCESGPVLVSEIPTAGTEAAEAVLARGHELMGEGDFEVALKLFNQILDEHADLPDLVARAKVRVQTCHGVLARALYSDAQDALIKGEIPRCLQLLQDIQEKHSMAEGTVARAAELQQKAGKEERRRDYLALLDEVEKNLSGGNLPQATQLVARLEADFQGYAPQGGAPAPGEALKRFGAALNKKQREFDNMKRVFEFFMGSESYAKAGEKLKEMEEQFPDHPFIEQARKRLHGRGASK